MLETELQVPAFGPIMPLSELIQSRQVLSAVDKELKPLPLLL